MIELMQVVEIREKGGTEWYMVVDAGNDDEEFLSIPEHSAQKLLILHGHVVEQRNDTQCQFFYTFVQNTKPCN